MKWSKSLKIILGHKIRERSVANFWKWNDFFSMGVPSIVKCVWFHMSICMEILNLIAIAGVKNVMLNDNHFGIKNKYVDSLRKRIYY